MTFYGFLRMLLSFFSSLIFQHSSTEITLPYESRSHCKAETQTHHITSHFEDKDFSLTHFFKYDFELVTFTIVCRLKGDKYTSTEKIHEDEDEENEGKQKLFFFISGSLVR